MRHTVFSEWLACWTTFVSSRWMLQILSWLCTYIYIYEYLCIYIYVLIEYLHIYIHIVSTSTKCVQFFEKHFNNKHVVDIYIYKYLSWKPMIWFQNKASEATRLYIHIYTHTHIISRCNENRLFYYISDLNCFWIYFQLFGNSLFIYKYEQFLDSCLLYIYI